MAYQNYGPPNTQGSRDFRAPQERQYSQYHASAQPGHGYLSVDQDGQILSDHSVARHTPVSASSQHRQPGKPSQYHHAPQKAYAVAVPPLLASPNNSVGQFTKSSLSQSAHVQAPHTSFDTSKQLSVKPSSQDTHFGQALDYQLLLLTLAEEYFATAYGYSSAAASIQGETQVSEYYKLMAIGLACLEALLSRFKLEPEREANVRLRYATVLYEETENTMEAEEALSKGISLCDRHRFFDLKYNMQHLLARILFGKHSRAALKFLDGVITDVEAYKHVAWIYAFRFLKVSMHLELSTHQDTIAALSQLRQLTAISNGYGDKTVIAVATTMEALTCLRNSGDADSIEQAQRALASVRSLQLDPMIRELHQVTVLASIVDLCCHLQQFDPVQAVAKMQVMQTELKNADEGGSWAPDGSFAIPFSNVTLPSCKSRNGIVRKQENGLVALMFNWMSKDDIYNLGYLLSGIAMVHRNTQDGQKSEHMLEEGIKRLEYTYRDTSKTPFPKSIVHATAHKLWQEQIACYMRFHLAFTLCARTSWPAAKEQQSMIQNSLQTMAASTGSVAQPLRLLSSYLEAIIYHGTGHLDQALSVYQSDVCSIHTYRKTPHPSHLHLNIALLSALNTLLIIRTPTHPDHHQLPSLVSFLEHLCIRNPNRQIQSAYHLVTATTSSSSTILMTKQSLQFALQTAKQSDNSKLVCIVLNLMSWKFFRGVVGEQAQKSAQASQMLAQKSMDGLWMSVAAGVLGDTLEAAGRIEEANRARENGLLTASTLPEVLQIAMGMKGDDRGGVSAD